MGRFFITARTRRRIRWALLAVLAAIVLLLAGLVALLASLWREEAPVSFDSARAAGIEFGGWTQIVPGPGLPQDLQVQAANNNVDAIVFDGAHYMAWRTSPHHFATPETRLVIVRSTDLQTWTLEREIQLEESDMREPRFLALNGTLFFYFFRAGSNPVAFEPKYIHMMERGIDGAWSEPQPIFEPGYVVWRVREHNGTGYMSVYHGAGLYTLEDRPGEIRLLTSSDGRIWSPISKAPQATTVSAEEAEFIFDDEGNLHATIRLETQGSLVCRAGADDLATWDCRYTPDKMDSAIMFRHAGQTYVLARRNVAGGFPRGAAWLPERWRRGWSLAAYSLTRKRTCLYAYDEESLECKPLFDFPSCGDTAFPGIIQRDANTFWIVNYSNDPDGFDGPWLWGQLNPTQLYAGELRFTGPP